MYQPTVARQQIPDWEIHLLIKSSSGLVHSIVCLLVRSLRLSRSEIVLNMSLPQGHGSAQYKLKIQSEERTTLIRFMQIRSANHRSRRIVHGLDPLRCTTQRDQLRV